MHVDFKKYLGLAPGLAALIIYSTTTCRSIWIGDSPEFALALKTLGICHPPGYPLFTIIGRIFVEILPFMRPILAAGLLDILAAAATVSAVYYICRRFTGSWSAVFISLIWAFTPTFWEETSGVEIYTLNLLLISLIFLLLECDKPWKWAMLSYLFGLALTNHPSALSILPTMIYYFIKEKQYSNWRKLPLYFLLIMFAGSVYLYIPIRSSLDPLSDWGSPSGLKALINHMTLAQYSGWISYSFENIMTSARLYFDTLFRSWWWIGALTTLFGFLDGMWIARTRTIGAALILITSILLASSHRALNYDPFYIPALFGSLLLTANLFIFTERKTVPKILSYVSRIALPAACLILILHNYRDQDKSGYTLAENYAKNMLDTAGSGIVFTAGDINSFPALYLRYAENYRPDVEIYDRSIRLKALLERAKKLSGSELGDYFSAREILIKLAGGKKFLAKNHYIYETDWLKLSEPIYSDGILYEIGEKPQQNPTVPKYSSDFRPGDVLSRQLLVNLDLSRGEEILSENSGDTLDAYAAFREAAGKLDEEKQAVVLNNVGIYFRAAGLPEMALNIYAKAMNKPIISKKDRKDIRFNISNIYKDKGNAFLASRDYQNAVISFTRSLDYDDDNPDVLLNIGLIYGQMLKDNVNARIYLKRYLEKKPSDTRARVYLNSLK